MLKSLFAATMAFAVSVPTLLPAQDFFILERFVLPVNQIDANSFEVVEADGAGPPQIWCAAGIYARRVLNQPSGDLYLEGARGPSQTQPGRKGIVFTTEPQDGAFSSITLSTRRVGLVKSVGLANSVCYDMPYLQIRINENRLLGR